MTSPLTSAPTLETERLTLRGPAREDLAPFSAWITTSERLAAQDETGTEADAWYFFLAGVGHWQWHGFGFFTLTPKGETAGIGRVGLLKHIGWDDVELAWHVFDEAEGKGFVTEAAHAVRDWAHAEIKPQRLVSYIDVKNTRSQGVATRLGAVNTGERARHDADSEIWEHAA